MLPKVFPSSKLFDVSAGLVTSTEIGGDYYDFFEKKDHSMLFVEMQLAMEQHQV